jgi:hypothetical protein
MSLSMQTDAVAHINLTYMVSIFLCYGLPATRMDAILATIVAGGQAKIQFNIEVNKHLLISTLIC